MPILSIDASRAVKKEKTGVEWYSWYLLQSMARCTPDDWKVWCYVPQESQISNLKSQNFETKVLRWIKRGWTQGRLSIEMMAHPPDVLFVPSHTIPFLHPEKTITTIHDVVFLKYPELYDPKDLRAQIRGFNFAKQFAKKIIVPSRATRDERVVVVEHGVNMLANRYKLHPNDTNEYLINSCNIRTNSRFILFIGRIEKKKNVMNLIHAFREVIHNPSQPPRSLGYARDRLLRGGESGLKLVLAGSKGYGAEDIDLAIKTFKFEDKVIQLGYVERARYQDLLNNAALLVFPSFGEGFGFPVLEAMSMGVPVVCSDISVLREVGGNAVQYVNPRDPEDIARGIAAVLNNEMLQSEMIKRGKERAKDFTWEKSAKSTWKIITGL